MWIQKWVTALGPARAGEEGGPGSLLSGRARKSLWKTWGPGSGLTAPACTSPPWAGPGWQPGVKGWGFPQAEFMICCGPPWPSQEPLQAPQADVRVALLQVHALCACSPLPSPFSVSPAHSLHGHPTPSSTGELLALLSFASLKLGPSPHLLLLPLCQPSSILCHHPCSSGPFACRLHLGELVAPFG